MYLKTISKEVIKTTKRVTHLYLHFKKSIDIINLIESKFESLADNLENKILSLVQDQNLKRFSRKSIGNVRQKVMLNTIK